MLDFNDQSTINYGGDADVFLTALNRALEPFHGSTLGNAPDGSTDIEFRNASDAYRFLTATEMADAHVLRDPVAMLTDRCVIVISLPLFMYRQAVSGRLGAEVSR